jgi:hypothetical protein
MSKSATALVIKAYRDGHESLLRLVQPLSDEQLNWRPSAVTNCIAFHLWHLARWADHFQAAIPGMTDELGDVLGPRTQIWYEENLTVKWGFDSAMLGFDETGLEMDHAAAVALGFPGKVELTDYARRAFSIAEQTVPAINLATFVQAEKPQPLTEGLWQPDGTVGWALLEHLTHDHVHIGLIQGLLEQQRGA